MKGLFVPAFDDFDAILGFASDLQSQSLVALDFSRIGFALPTGMLLLASVIARANVEGRIAHSLGWTAYDYEPRRVCRRLISFSYAAMGSVSRAA